MKKRVIILLYITSLITPIWSANSGFSASELTFKDGSGWKETTSTICGDSIRVLQAKGNVILSNGIVLDSTVGTVRSFIDRSLIGAITPFAGTTIPPGWLACDGAIIRVTSTSNCEYQVLANRIQTTWGPADNPGIMVSGKFVGRFKLPDLRGQFLRGANTGLSTNPRAITTATMSTARENLADTTNYGRFRTPAFGTAITISGTAQLTQTVGSYQRSGFTEHSTAHNFTPANSYTNPSNETHTHPTAILEGGYTLYDGILNDVQNDFDPSYGGGDGTTTYMPLNGTATQASEEIEATHTHTNPAPALAPGPEPHSYPDNVGVLFGIRY